jgi:putative ABC transport system permease protein
MSPFAIALRNITNRSGPSLLTALIVALGVGLALAVVVLTGGIRRGLITAGGPFELVIGPKGSATQLVMSSILLQDVPLGNMAYSAYEELTNDPRVATAIPLALGDNIQGLRIVGTTLNLFRVQVSPAQPPFYQLAQGRMFNQEFEAVLGSAAAQQLGLQPGDSFVGSHGVLESFNANPHASNPYQVVGLLAPTNTPADLGIYVSLQSYYEVHGHPGISTPAGEVLPVTPAEQEEAPEITAVLVRARDISAAYQLYQELNSGIALQAALPGAVLTTFLDLVGQGQQLLILISYVALAMAGLSSGLSLYNAVQAQRHDIAVLRAIGAPRGTILAIALIEALIQSVIGLMLGLVIGYSTAFGIAQIIRQRSALAVVPGFEPGVLLIFLGIGILGLLAGIVPAIRAYRTDTVTALSQN